MYQTSAYLPLQNILKEGHDWSLQGSEKEDGVNQFKPLEKETYSKYYVNTMSNLENREVVKKIITCSHS